MIHIFWNLGLRYFSSIDMADALDSETLEEVVYEYVCLHVHVDEGDNVGHAAMALKNDVATPENSDSPIADGVKFSKCFHSAWITYWL